MERQLLQTLNGEMILHSHGVEWYSAKYDHSGNIKEYQKEDLALKSLLAIVEEFGGVEGIKKQIKTNEDDGLPF